MTSVLRGSARALAAAIALLAIVDPALPLPASERPSVRIVGERENEVTTVTRALADSGFGNDRSRPEAATVLVTDRWPARDAEHTWIVDSSPVAPSIRVTSAAAARARLPGQSLEVRVGIEARGLRGTTTGVELEDGGLPVASVRHQWTRDDERWEASLQYLPAAPDAGRLRVRAETAPGETRVDDNSADVAVPAIRGPVRTLVVEAGVTWPALFVRRALEGEGAFAVSALQRAAPSIATRAGGPPSALTRESLKPFEVIVVGGPDQLTAADVEALRWFVEARGGIAVFVPDQRPTGSYRALTGVTDYEARALEAPVRIGADLTASELVVPKGLPPSATRLADDPQKEAVVFSVRRGAGAVVFSGALDAWRHRGENDEAFARFWRRAIAASALSVPPVLEVTAEPSIVRPGDRVTLTARLRDSEISGSDRVELSGVEARAVEPDARIDLPLRLWPTAEPGLFSGEWRPALPGVYNVTASVSGFRGDATVTAAGDVARSSPIVSAQLSLVAGATGGQLFPLDRLPELVAAMKAAYPPQRIIRRRHPMRSPWWSVPFAALLCGEWAVRRKRGLP